MRMYNKTDMFYCGVGFLLLGAVYVLVFGKYRPAEIDDAWTASYVWSLTHLRSTVDSVFGQPSNIQFFGHIHAYVAGAVADVAGWSKSTFHLLNSACIAVAAAAWWGIARKLLPQRNLAVLFVVMLFLLEPFLGAALKARSDAMAFMFMSLGTCAAVYKRFFLATVLVCLGIEVHPIAITGGFWVAVLAMYREPNSLSGSRAKLKHILCCLLGAVVGFCLYRYMHPEPLADIFAYLRYSVEGSSGSFNALTAHYFSRAYFRFVPELIFLLSGAVLFFFKKKRLIDVSDPVCLLFWVTLILSFVIRRANFHYVIFFYPPFMLAALAGFAQSRLFRPAVALLLVYALCLSGLLVWQNRHVDHAAFDRNLRAMQIPEDTTPVVGPTNAWFVMRERSFYANFGALVQEQGPSLKRAYYLQSDYSVSMPACAQRKEPIGNPFVFNGTKVEALVLDLSGCDEKGWR